MPLTALVLKPIDFVFISPFDDVVAVYEDLDDRFDQTLFCRYHRLGR